MAPGVNSPYNPAAQIILSKQPMSRSLGQRYRIVLPIAVVASLVWAALMVAAAIGHNPQNEYVDTSTGQIRYLALSLIFVSWAGLIMAAVLLVSWTLAAATRLARRLTR